MVSGVTPPAAGIFANSEFTDEDVRGLETVAARAWPASERISLDGWLLRSSDTPTRRVNSVLAQSDGGRADLDVRLEAVEDFYARRGNPPRFQLTRGSLPADLDEILAARGYAIEAPTDVQIALPDTLVSAPPASEIDINAAADAAWTQVYTGGFDRDISSVTKMIDGLTGFLSYRVDDEVIGVALGVIVAGWLGIFGMQTRPAFRNKGIGGAMISGLAAWALAENAAAVYLQVEHDNPDARRLYERHGFRTVYSYHYRTKFSDDRNQS